MGALAKLSLPSPAWLLSRIGDELEDPPWPAAISRLALTTRGAFGYITGVLRNGENMPLCRMRYGGSAHSFGFAIYSAAHDRYQDAILRTGLPTGTPQEALDTACTIHLAGLGHEPGS
jgi:hypothetical protein